MTFAAEVGGDDEDKEEEAENIEDEQGEQEAAEAPDALAAFMDAAPRVSVAPDRVQLLVRGPSMLSEWRCSMFSRVGLDRT